MLDVESQRIYDLLEAAENVDQRKFRLIVLKMVQEWR
jgi:hypothetical protein